MPIKRSTDSTEIIPLTRLPPGMAWPRLWPLGAPATPLAGTPSLVGAAKSVSEFQSLIAWQPGPGQRDPA